MEFLDGRTVGIDLGTSNSALAYLDESGDPVLATNSDGNPVTPSIITMVSDKQVQVGKFDPNLVQDPDNVVIGIKRQMGSSDFALEFGQRRLTPEFLSALILRKVREDAEARIGPVGNAVISVPYYFNDACRRATSDAGQIAGLNVIDIINEPTAATLAYAWLCGDLGRPDFNHGLRTILVYDLGGGTFDVTVVQYEQTHFRVLSTDGDTFLGGLDWTRRIVDHAATELIDRFGHDPRNNPSSSLQLLQACEEAKIRLQQVEETTIAVPAAGATINIAITRSTFEDITADLLQRTRDTTELVLEQCGKTVDDLDDVVLVGGSTLMPAVTRMLEQMTGRSPAPDLDPQRAVAQGAAIHAAMLDVQNRGINSSFSNVVRNRLLGVRSEDVNAHSLGVEIQDSNDISQRSNHIMIPRNSRLPAMKTQQFFTNRSNPQGIVIRLIEGEAADVTACTYVGRCRISGLPPNLPIGTPVEVSYSFDEKRHIHVSARELAGNTQASVKIVWESGLQGPALNNFRELAGQFAVQ
jgi:molecular chaperone DnaK